MRSTTVAYTRHSLAMFRGASTEKTVSRRMPFFTVFSQTPIHWIFYWNWVNNQRGI